jgi:hypothetical protein
MIILNATDHPTKIRAFSKYINSEFYEWYVPLEVTVTDKTFLSAVAGLHSYSSTHQKKTTWNQNGLR